MNCSFLGSKERDTETGLDFFQARYFSSVQGRFSSPDDFAGGPTELFAEIAAHNPTFYAELAEPQSLNKYGYCLNNPLKFIDPDGHQATMADAIRQGISAPAPPWAKVLIAAGGVLAVGYETIKDSQIVKDLSSDGGRYLCEGFACAQEDVMRQNILNKANSDPKEIIIDGGKYPESAKHIDEAQQAGQPSVLTVDRGGAKGNRKNSLAGQNTVKGKDRDEYPPAVTKEGGRGASVKPISPSDNRGSGASIGSQIRNVPDGGKIKIVVKPTPEPKP